MLVSTINRRTFIRLALLGRIGAGLAYIQHQTAGLGMWNFLRWSIRGQLKNISPPAIVGLLKCDSYDADLGSILHELWDLSAMPDVRGKRILVKPNLLDTMEDNLATTNPKIIGAVLDLLADLGASTVLVGDGSAFRRDTYSVVRNCGLALELNTRG